MNHGILFLLLTGVASTGSARQVGNDGVTTTNCLSCSVQQGDISVDEQRKLMIELAKMKLLKKLNLTEAPSISGSEFRPLPAPFVSTINKELQRDDTRTVTRTKTNPESGRGKLIIVAREEFHPDDIYLSRSRHFTVHLGENLFQYDVRSAAFWVAPAFDTINITARCTMYVSETQGSHRTRTELPAVPGRIMAKGKLQNGHGEWIRFDVTDTLHRWLRHPRRHQDRRFTVSCLGCLSVDDGDSGVPVRTDVQYKPFLEIDTKKKAQRKRRSVNPRPLNGGCYLEKLYVNFTEIGWHTWIRQPPGYNANYCKGTCVHHDVLTTTYSDIMMEVIKSRPAEIEALIAPCCAAIETGSISIVYEMEPNQYIYEKLDDMVADKCDCR